jgi:hypothetical protein
VDGAPIRSRISEDVDVDIGITPDHAASNNSYIAPPYLAQYIEFDRAVGRGSV